MNKIAVYTCITGGYDLLLPPVQTDPRIDYFCFSDSLTTAMPPWQGKEVRLPELTDKDKNRFVKMHPHLLLPLHDVTIYVDGNIEIVGDIYRLVESIAKAPGDIFLYQHPFRNCLYDEAATCAHYALDSIWAISAQMRRYSRDGFPRRNGLFEASVIVRRNTPTCSALMEAWWREYQSGAKRDQLSLTYLSWRSGVPLASLGKSDPRFTQQTFKFHHHPLRERTRGMRRRQRFNRRVARLFKYHRLFGQPERLDPPQP